MANSYIYRLKERFFKRYFLFQDWFSIVLLYLAKLCDMVLFVAGLMFVAFLVFRVGFSDKQIISNESYSFLQSVFIVSYFAKYVQELIRIKRKKNWAIWVEGIFFVIHTVILIGIWKNSSEIFLASTFSAVIVLITVLTMLFVSEGYKLFRIINTLKISPPLLFSMSFLFLIIVGSGLLMLPDVHTGTLSYLDALFTSVSAVCVTGLVAVDTATAFTMKGQLIIMMLIQLGGLGIMAFTGFFAFAFTGTISFEDRILLKDIFSSESLGGVFRLLLKIILLTFLIEALGAFLIYISINDQLDDPVFFSIFHSISAFCNAGFSIFSNGLADGALSGNYFFFLSIAALIILGGIGFPVVLSYYAVTKFYFLSILGFPFRKSPAKKIRVKNAATRIVTITTFVLLITGTVFYFLLERNTSMADKGFGEQMMISFFGSVTSRTAGFNIIDMSALGYPAVLVIIGLMWIGASPGSTGGGIKTTTFAIAVSAAYNFIRGKHQIEVGYRRIGQETISRVLVVISLSILFIFFGYMFLLMAEPGHNPVFLLFETVSAYSTVGLSLAGTPSFGDPAKWVIIVMMFVGRVGPLTLLSGLFISNQKRYYRFPEHNLTIN
jgi:trk system potassium uptake protein